MYSSFCRRDNLKTPVDIINKHIENLRVIIAGLSKRTVTRAMLEMPFHPYLPDSVSFDLNSYIYADIKKLCDTFRYAIESLTKIIEANNELARPINAANVDLLLSIPAIRKDWHEIMKYQPLELMSQTRQEIVRESVGVLAHGRIAKIKELQQEIQKLSSNADAIYQLQQKVKTLSSDLDAIDELDSAITKLARPAPFRP